MPVELLPDGRKRITPPLTEEDVLALEAGDAIDVNGMVYGARDAAHKRMAELLDAGEPLPFDPRGAVVYYVGPTPERPGNVIGAAGPTTAGRMDRYTPHLLEMGVKGMIGKGGRGEFVREELRRHTAVYMAALGGGGALAAPGDPGSAGRGLRRPRSRGDPGDPDGRFPRLGRERLPGSRLLCRDHEAMAPR
jgi:tartrate/fumarate subfamily iron-sulfur-dependent hydro-lyase beta chain